MAHRRGVAAFVAAGFLVLGGAGLFAARRSAALSEAETPRPALVVVSKDTSSLLIVNPDSLQVVASVQVGPVPHEVAVSDDGKLALVTNYGAKMDGTSVSVVDLEAQKELHRISLLSTAGPRGEKFGDLIGPHGVAFFEGKFYFTAEGSKKIARYDPAINAVDWVHEIGQNRTHMLVLSKQTHTIYTSNVNSDSVTAVEAHDGHWENTVISVGKGPEGIDLSPDGQELWAANSGDGTVSIIETASKRVVETVQVGTKRSNRVKFTPDGKLVLISDIASGDLIIVDVLTRKLVNRVHVGSSAEGILVPPHSWRVYVAASPDNKIAVLDLKALEKMIFPGPASDKTRPTVQDLKTLVVAKTFEAGKDPDGMAWRGSN